MRVLSRQNAQCKLFKQTTILLSSENIQGFKIYKKVKGKCNKTQTQDKTIAWSGHLKV